jgi:serine/threonine protein kinase
MLKRVGIFDVQREIGRGGMGVVYLATDTRLNRQVAIKALPEHLASDPVRLERFEREAKTLAQLNHSNLAGIHGVEEQDGARYLVLEYVEGPTLADMLDSGPLQALDAIEYAVQIAAGIEAAHEEGVVHRDLKPGNIIITPDGKAKVLDFGLSRTEESQSSTGALDSPTMTAPLQHSPTIEGAILGTAAYMSPEQARGRRVDKRTDIWSFGVVLYEMLVGASPFVGETASDSIGAVLHKGFDLAQLPSGTPSNVRRVLKRCLERDKNLRYRDIGDVRIELLEADGSDPVDRQSTGNSTGALLGAVLGTAVVVAVIAGALGWFTAHSATPEPERVVRKFKIHSAGSEDRFNSDSPQISPDGMKVALVQDDAIMIRDLASFETETLVEAVGVRRLVWSRDGRSIVYATTNQLYRVLVNGGAATRIGDYVINMQMAWDDNDRILFSDDANFGAPGICAVSARGGNTEVIYEADSANVIDFHAITTIPGTGIVLLVRHSSDQRTPIEAWDGERFVVIADYDDQYSSVPVWSPSGHILFARGFGELDLWAVPFSPERMEITGDPFLVLTDASAPSVSEDGTLSIVRGSIGLSGELVWVLPDGSVESIGDGGALVQGPIVSHDNARIAFAGGSSPKDLEVWVRDIERGINTRISNLEGFMIPVAWSPDGREIAVMNFDPAQGTEGQQTVFLASDGTGPTRDPYPGLLSAFDAGWTRAVQSTDPRSGTVTLSAVDLSDMSVQGEIISTQGAFLFVSISPDGKHLLYSSRDSGEKQVYCTRFPSGEARWQVSSDGGDQPQWSLDGAAVYYKSLEGDFMQVDVTREPTLRFGIPRATFDSSPEIAEFASLIPSPDGERFITVRGEDDDAKQSEYQLLLIENWYEEFRDGIRR